MEDYTVPMIVALVLRGLAMLLALVGGIVIARYGFHLYRDGVGTSQGKLTLELGKLKINAQSAGCVVMATAFLWAWAGVLLRPDLEIGRDKIRIYSLDGGRLETQSVAAKTTKSPSIVKNDPDELKKLLEKAYAKIEKTSGGVYVKLDGKPASIDLSSVDVAKSSSGKYLLSTVAKSATDMTKFLLEPNVKDDSIVFTPKSVGQVDQERKRLRNE